MRRYEELVGYLLVGHTLHHAGDDLLFPSAQRFVPLVALRFADQPGEFVVHRLGTVVHRYGIVVTFQGGMVGKCKLQCDAFHVGIARILLELLQRKEAERCGIHQQNIRMLPRKHVPQLVDFAHLVNLGLQVLGTPYHGDDAAAYDDRRLRHRYLDRNAHPSSSTLFSSLPTAGTNSRSSTALWEARSFSQLKMSNSTLLISFVLADG